MSRKSSKKPAKPPVTELQSKPAGTAYPVDQAELDAQNVRLKKAAAAGAGALKSSSSSDEPPSPAVPAAKPMSMLDTLKPESAGPAPDSSQTVGRAPQNNSAAPAAAAPGTPARAAEPPKPPSPPAKQTLPPAKVPASEVPHRSQDAGKVNVTFVFHEPSAKQVSVRGEFNGWSAEATPMKRHHDGHWEASVALAPGRYEYKFFVDGQWVADPRAQQNVGNPHGTLNSVLLV